MAVVSEAYLRGCKKGLSIVANPNPRRLEKTRAAINQRQLVGAAWISTGQTLQAVMSQNIKKS